MLFETLLNKKSKLIHFNFTLSLKSSDNSPVKLLNCYKIAIKSIKLILFYYKFL